MSGLSWVDPLKICENIEPDQIYAGDLYVGAAGAAR